MWDMVSGREIATLGGFPSNAWSVSFSPDGKRLAAGGGHWGNSAKQDRQGWVQVWDMVAGQEVASFREEGTVYGVAYSPDGARLVVAGTDKVGRVWGPP